MEPEFLLSCLQNPAVHWLNPVHTLILYFLIYYYVHYLAIFSQVISSLQVVQLKFLYEFLFSVHL
jgi:hypothetical protein